MLVFVATVCQHCPLSTQQPDIESRMCVDLVCRSKESLIFFFLISFNMFNWDCWRDHLYILLLHCLVDDFLKILLIGLNMEYLSVRLIKKTKVADEGK